MYKLSKTTQQVKKVFQPNIIRAIIPSGGATAGPPLGSTLGAYGLPAAKFVDEFNNLTKDFKPGIPIPVRIHVQGKRFQIEMREPSQSYLILQAAGLAKGGYRAHCVSGKITYKHVYEIAKVKMQEDNLKFRSISMKQMCELVTHQCWTMGVHVVSDINPVRYENFLKLQLKRAETKKELKKQKMLEESQLTKKK